MHLLLSEYCCVQSAIDPVGHALLHEGWGMLRAIVEDLSHAGHHLTVLANPVLQPRLSTFTGVEVISTSPEAELDLLARWSTRTDAVLVVAPEFHGLLEQRVRLVRNAGGISINCDPGYLSVLADKYAVCSLLPSPPTIRWSPHLTWDHFPAVLKPVDGAGSQGLRVVDTIEGLREAAHNAQADGWPDLIVQPYEAGFAVSVCLLAGSHPQVCPPTEQLLSQDGRMHYQGARYPLSVEAIHRVETLLQELPPPPAEGLLGWIGADVCLSPEGKDFFFDINPRLTTSYLALRQRCRRNLGDAMVRIAMGEKVLPLEWDEMPLEFRVTE